MTSVNWKTNLVLLLFLIALTIVTYHTNDKQNKANDQQPLSSILPENADRIQITKNNKVTLIEKQGDIWHLTQPINVKANQFRIGSLLNLLTTDNVTRYTSTDLDLSRYGLAQPSLSVVINDQIFDFGITNPINNKRYVLSGSSVFLIEDIFYPLINSQLGTLVDQKLLADSGTITKLQTNKFTLSKNTEGLWESSLTASADAINETISQWKNAQAFGVHDYSTHKSDALDKISIYINNQLTPTTYIVTSKKPWLIIARPDLMLEYHFDAEMFERLLLINKPENK